MDDRGSATHVRCHGQAKDEDIADCAKKKPLRSLVRPCVGRLSDGQFKGSGEAKRTRAHTRERDVGQRWRGGGFAGRRDGEQDIEREREREQRHFDG